MVCAWEAVMVCNWGGGWGRGGCEAGMVCAATKCIW